MLKSPSQKKAHDEQLHLNVKSESSYTPLHQAAIAGDDAAVEVLLVSGASRFATDNKHGNTPLHEAAWRGYSRCVKLLCTQQQTPRSAGKKFGKKAKSVKHVEDEWKNQNYLNTANAGGFSPLHLASQNGHNQSCREILLAGANPDVKNNYGDTPLHTSCRYGHAGATRILLSAKCDPTSVNLNYDTPLHISCAMGRRKLTRILYEVCGPSGLLLRNAQGETPRDISIRKNLKPIIEILNSTLPNITMKCASDEVMDEQRPRKQQTQHRSDSGSGQNYTSDASDKLKPKRCVNNKKPHDPNSPDDPKIWSPYGCHYFPDPRSFPPPKLETFPKDPLQLGEQYYCDLAGNIRIGQVGIGNTCYCGPFFNHIEQKINQNKKCFKKYVIKAKHDSKGHDEKIHRIARSIMAEHREKHGFDYWPKRSDPLRATVVPQSSKCRNDEMNNNTLSRCRSLEFLDERKSMDGKNMEQNVNRVNLHRSFDLLNSAEQHEVIVHDHSKKYDAISSKYNSIHQPSTNTSESGQKSSSKQYALDFREKYGGNATTYSTRSDVESLEDFTNQSMEIIQMKRAARQRFKERTMNELRERQKVQVDGSFLKLPPNFSSTLTAGSINDLRDYHSSNHYPTDFDDISVEMRNITKLLSSSIIEPLESTPSTSSSFCHSTDKLAKRFTLYDKGNADAATAADDNDYIDGESCDDATNSCTSLKLPIASGTTLTMNGFFQNKSFGQNQSSSSCDTLKSIELPRTNGNTNGHHNGDEAEEAGEEEGEEEEEEETDDEEVRNGSAEESDTDLEESISVAKEPISATATATTHHRMSIAQHVPRTGLVSARIKSLLAKNLQTSNKMPTVRSSLGTNASTFKSSKLLRAQLKSCDSAPMKINAASNSVSTKKSVRNPFDTERNGDSSENEAGITVHTATVHANQIQTDSNDERTKFDS